MNWFFSKWRLAAFAVTSALVLVISFQNCSQYEFTASENESLVDTNSGFSDGDQGIEPDYKKPEIHFVSGPDKLTNKENVYIQFEFSVDEKLELDSLYCRLNSGDWEICETNLEVNSSTQGEQLFEVQVTDSKGQVTTEHFIWSFDSEGPNIIFTSYPGVLRD